MEAQIKYESIHGSDDNLKQLDRELIQVCEKHGAVNFVACTYLPSSDVLYAHFPDDLKLHRAYMQRLLHAAKQHEANLLKN